MARSHLVTRDIDLLFDLARHDAAAVAVSLTTLDDELRRIMELRTSRPIRRLAAIRKLAEAGIPVGVMTAPVIERGRFPKLSTASFRRYGGVQPGLFD